MSPALPSITELEHATLSVLRNAGDINQLTVRTVRQKLEEQFSLAPGSLEAKEYKSSIKKTIVAGLDELQHVEGAVNNLTSKQSHASHGVPPKGEDTPPRDEEKAAKGKHEKGKRKRKVVELSTAELEGPETRKGRTEASSHSSFSPKTKKVRKVESGKFKSKTIIESSGDEDEPAKSTSPSHALKKGSKSIKPKPKKISPVKVAAQAVPSVGPPDDEAPGPSMFKQGSSVGPETSIPPRTSADDDDTRSELSSVIDEPPKKQRKQEKKRAPQNIKQGKKAKEPPSKAEETIAKLKSVIVACGVRKAWKKEFQGLEKASQQINRLHEILRDLGMAPRFTMEKAKAIRKKRELAQELQDVQDFEEAMHERDRRKDGNMSDSEDSDGSSSGSHGPSVKKKKTAGDSIKAFLRDLGDD